MTDLTVSPASPFDAIRNVRDDGSEYWSARDLADLAGYVEWRKFEGAIERARQSTVNQGMNPADHFVGAAKMVSLGSGASRAIGDFELSRFAAYLVFQNGDPRKSEIAGAQGYFAIKTREAEVATTQPLDEIEVAERYLSALRERKALAARVEAQAPLVAQAEAFREADGLRTIGDLANDLKVHAATNFPDSRVLHKDVFDLAGRLDLIIRGNTVRNNQPTARAIEAGWVRPKESVYETESHGAQAKVSTRLTPRGWGRLWDAATTNLRQHGVVLPDIREIAA